uniref:Germ cell-specific gene 1-like protein n=1 Tax=Cyprinodon variegatus TaxID=28743 RepID=A0A3Q2FZA5_CYPVA
MYRLYFIPFFSLQPAPPMMTFLKRARSPSLSFFQTVVSLLLSTVALTSPFWCTGKQKIPKPLCTANKITRCIPVPGLSNNSNIQFFWETGDDRFVFPTFHTGLFIICEENIYVDEWGEKKCRGFYSLTPESEEGKSFIFMLIDRLKLLPIRLFQLLHSSSAAMMWLCLTLEFMYVGLLLVSCLLLSGQLCIRAWFPSTVRWGQLLNSFAAVFTVLGGLLGMVGHMMFMQVFQTTVSMGPEDFKPHSYGYSWAFYGEINSLNSLSTFKPSPWGAVGCHRAAPGIKGFAQRPRVQVMGIESGSCNLLRAKAHCSNQ